jgi:hypothetical protein
MFERFVVEHAGTGFHCQAHNFPFALCVVNRNALGALCAADFDSYLRANIQEPHELFVYRVNSISQIRDIHGSYSSKF